MGFIKFYSGKLISQVKLIHHILLFIVTMLVLKMSESNILKMNFQILPIILLEKESSIYIFSLIILILKKLFSSITKSSGLHYYPHFGLSDGINANTGTTVLKKWLMFMRIIKSFSSLLMCFGVTLITWIDGEILLLQPI